MNEEEKINPAPEDEDPVSLEVELDPVLEEILAGYRAEMAELYENRRRRAIERANMTEEELIASLVGDLGEVISDAEVNGVEIVAIPEDGNDEDEGEDDE